MYCITTKIKKQESSKNMSVEARILNFQFYVSRRIKQINRQLATEEVIAEE